MKRTLSTKINQNCFHNGECGIGLSGSIELNLGAKMNSCKQKFAVDGLDKMETTMSFRLCTHRQIDTNSICSFCPMDEAWQSRSVSIRRRKIIMFKSFTHSFLSISIE